MIETKHNIRLTSAEIAQLWSQYMADSMALRMLSYFRAKVEDVEVREILDFALHLARQHVDKLSKLFEEEAFPVPHGFTEQDVQLGGRRLYSDSFYLTYLRNAACQGLSIYAFALGSSARDDVRDYFSHCLASTTELYNRVAHLLLTKGLYIRAPYLPMPEVVEYVHKESFLNGVFGDRRPLNAMEINHVYNNIQTNALGKALIFGFAQTACSKEVREYFLRGKEIAHKQMEVLSALLKDEDLPAPMTWDSDVLDSAEPVFSDKLMLFQVVSLNAMGISNYGAALGVAQRRDLASTYMRLMAEIGTYVDDGAELLIRNGWMEKMPGNIDRRVLVNNG